MRTQCAPIRACCVCPWGPRYWRFGGPESLFRPRWAGLGSGQGVKKRPKKCWLLIFIARSKMAKTTTKTEFFFPFRFAVLVSPIGIVHTKNTYLFSGALVHAMAKNKGNGTHKIPARPVSVLHSTCVGFGLNWYILGHRIQVEFAYFGAWG